MEEQLIIIRTVEEMQALEVYLEDKDFIAYDTETTGVGKDDTVIGFSICAEVDVGYYVITAYWDKETQTLIELPTAGYAPQFVRLLVGKSLIMQNSPFDCWMTVNNYGVELMPSVHTDTMVLAHILDENRHCGLKELGVSIFGEDARKEQIEMKESVERNGGVLNKTLYELYKADADLIARYGAKDAILTLKLFYHFVPQLFEQGLDKFFYEEECMPLLRGPTYEMNTAGLKIDPEKLQNLKVTLEAECLEALASITEEITPYVRDKYPGTNKTNNFNMNATQQMAWLLFIRLGNEFGVLTDSGKELCEKLGMRVPYHKKAKLEFIAEVSGRKGQQYAPAAFNKKTGKMGQPKKVRDPWQYLSCGKESLNRLAKKYRWVETFIEYKKNQKLLKTYVSGIQNKLQYGIIRPSFLQHGTTSGRYSSRSPNFQNLPRDDKRVKSCVVARPGMVLVGADQSQLEPRVFASVSQDPTLMACFASGDDFYSVVGAPIFEKKGLSLRKSGSNSFAVRYPELRDKSKVIALATPYGRTAHQQASTMGISREESQYLIDRYFTEYPNVEDMMLESHEQVKTNGAVYSIFGRPRRIPEAKKIREKYGNMPHGELPYEARTLLNLAMNHRVQSTGASIMNRSAIAFYTECRRREGHDARWKQVRTIMQVHDELIVECPEELAEQVAALLKDCMENSVVLPGVALLAEPKIAYNLADLK